MITKEQYFSDGHGGQKSRRPEHEQAAGDLLKKINQFLDSMAEVMGWGRPIDPDTGSEISGTHGGNGDGGFRTPDTKTGAAHSRHQTAHAVDVFDPSNKLDDYISKHDKDHGKVNDLLEQFGLYREAPTATNGWCHLQDVPPGSQRRTYLP